MAEYPCPVTPAEFRLLCGEHMRFWMDAGMGEGVEGFAGGEDVAA